MLIFSKYKTWIGAGRTLRYGSKTHEHIGTKGVDVSRKQSTCSILSAKIKKGMYDAFGDDVGKHTDAHVLHTKQDYGDYQCNAAMKLAKTLNRKPSDIAHELVQHLKCDGVVREFNVSGPGFINIVLSEAYLSQSVRKMIADKSGRLGIDRVSTNMKKRVIIDYSSPNIAKEMHVGHLRSTIIGDSLSRTFEFIGHDVLRLNHVGDWGTQFGMLIHFMNQRKASGSEAAKGIADMVTFYKAAKKLFDTDSDFQTRARQEVVKLQSGNVESMQAWKDICAASRKEFESIYGLLRIRNLEERGESYYNDLLEDVIESISAKNMIEESDGAKCVFLPGYFNADGTRLPLILRKSDGGYLYATTDVAAIKQRVSNERADLILYVTDAGQAHHFKPIFEVARAAGFLDYAKLNRNVELKHVPFGVVLGEDGKKIKTRSGDSIKLKDLLDEAILKAEESLSDRHGNDFTVQQRCDAARVIGIGSVKYADLSMNRESNYGFSFNKMLSMNGNTAPYLLYTYARIQGIKRKAISELESEEYQFHNYDQELLLNAAEEIILAKHLIRFHDIVEIVERDMYPNTMCEYIFELSNKFNQFYEKCPVLRAGTSEVVRSRVALCTATANTLALSLDLLGIETIDKL